MGHGDHGAGVLVQELFEPQDRFGVQVVGGLVEQQQVGGLKQQLAQRHTAAFATRAHGDRGVGVGALQRVHRLLELRVEVPAVRGVDLGLQLAHLVHQRVEVGVWIRHLLAYLVEARDFLRDITERHLDVLAHGLVVVERRLLLQDADGEARGQCRLAVADGVEARHDFEQCGLAHAVGADHTDFRARQEAQRDVVENHAVSVSLTGVDHLIDKLSQSWFRSLLDCFLHGSGHTCIAHYSKRGLQRPPSHSKTYPGHKRSLTSSRISAPLWPDGVVYANVSAVTWICFRFGILTMIIGARKVWDWLVYFLLG